MRIAMLGWELPPFVSGGLGTHCYHLTQALAEQGAQIDFFMPAAPGVRADWMRVVPVGTEYERTGSYGSTQIMLQSQTLDFFRQVEEYNDLCWRRVAREHARKPYDVIHAHDWITARAAIRAAQELNIPLVVTMHSTEFDRTAGNWPWEWILNIEKAACARATRIIAVSGMLATILEKKLGADPRKIRVVYNATDTRRFAAPHVDARKRDPVVLFYSRMSVQKSPEHFLRAAKRVLEKRKDVQFVMAGKGDLLTRMIDLSMELGLGSHVTFTGFVRDADVPKMYQQASVYVLPSASEPFGITVLEAMASGTPVIVSKTSGVTEVAHNLVRVDFWDVDKLAESMLAMVEYDALAQELKHNMPSDVNGVSWEKSAANTLAVYNEVCAHG